MDIITREELISLIETQKGQCASLFMPTHRAGAGGEVQQDSIRLKNLLKEAEEKLIQTGIRSPEAEELLEPAMKFLQDRIFWQYQDEGLALFFSQEIFRYYRLPIKFEELVVVSRRFHTKPLLPLLTSSYRFLILALSQNNVRLFQCTPYSVDEIDLKDIDIPKSFDDVLKYEDFEKQIQFHTGTPQSRGDRSAIFHGHGVGTDDINNIIPQYFYQIDKGLNEVLRQESAPLIFAGVDYLLPIYKEANTYPHLLDEGAAGNPDELSGKELHEKAWSIVKPHFQKAENDAAERYRELSATGQTSNTIKEIVPAAYQGRVETLFVAVGLQQWGSFHPDTNTIIFHEEEEQGDQDLLDIASVHTFLKRGVVFAVSPEKVPGNTPLAAIFRY